METFIGQGMMRLAPWVPDGGVLCDGWEIPINDTLALFALPVTTDGGNGRTTLQLTDLRMKFPMGFQTMSRVGGQGVSHTA
jgi:microcystin-dependent protein